MEGLAQNNGTTSISDLPNNRQTQNSINQQQMQNNNIIMTNTEIVSNLNNQMQNPLPNQMPQMPNQTPQMSNQMPNQMSNQMPNQMPNQMTEMPNNIVSENIQQQNNPNYNELINQLQKASSNGTTTMPSRDIPIDPNLVKNDVQVKPNYIPEQKIQEDYIKNLETPENLIIENKNNQQNIDNIESIYQELQIPVIIGLLYFLFQLPIVKKYSLKILPALFNKDGNPNIYDYIANSILFASSFYILIKLINNLMQNM